MSGLSKHIPKQLSCGILIKLVDKVYTKHYYSAYSHLERVRHERVHVGADHHLAVTENQREAGRERYQHRRLVLEFDGGDASRRLAEDADARAVNQRLKSEKQQSE